MAPRRLFLLIGVLLLLILAACNGGQAANPTPQPTAPVVTQAAPSTPPTEAVEVTGERPAELPPTGLTPSANPTPEFLPSGVATLPLAEPSSTAQPDAVQFPDPQGYRWTILSSDLQVPISITAAYDGSGRMFINEKAGRIRILQSGELLSEPFMDLTDRVGSQSSEQGLLGLAFHPRYAENGQFFVHYSDRNGDTVLSRFQVSASDPNHGDPASEVILLQQDQPYPNHNGGQLAFGPDGYLYFGLGDGGSAGDPQNNGQSLDTWLGKILRLNVDQGQPYGVPADNPFVNGGGRSEIWAYGLRNPWRFSFDMLTGDMYIADVGQNQWEEIDYLPAGSPGGTNFGWRFKEGTHTYEDGASAAALLVDPVYEYDHSLGCSVTGGYVYRGQSLPEWYGIYIFGDYCGGRIWGLMRLNGQWVGQEMFVTGAGLTAFGQDEAGEVYMLDAAGSVLRLDRQ